MRKPWLMVAGLVVVLVGLFLAGFWGWWYQQTIRTPFLFEVPQYQLSPKWYLGVFQPVFIRQVTQKGTEYFVVAYRNPNGRWVTGKVVVGGPYQNQLLPWLPEEVKGQSGTVEDRKSGHRYPFRLGQRLSFSYLVAKKGADMVELADICQGKPRICQAGQLTLAQGKLASQLTQPGGWEPKMPVVAVGVSQELVNDVAAGVEAK